MKRKEPKAMTQKQIDSMMNLFKILASMVLAILVIVLLALTISDYPAKALRMFFLGPVDSVRHIGNWLENMIPLLITGAGTCLIFASGEMVLSGNACLLWGALFTSIILTQISAPGPVLIVISLIVAALVGAFFVIIPIYMRNKFGTEPFIFSMILNYAALNVANFILNYYLKDPNYISGNASYLFPEDTRWPSFIEGTGVSMALPISFVLIGLAWFMIYRTRLGYRGKMIRVNRGLSRNLGSNCDLTSILLVAIGGAMIGMCGSMEMMGKYARYMWTVYPTFGNDGFLLATIAGNNPLLIPFASAFLAYLRTGTGIMNVYADIPQELVNTLQSVMIIMIAARGLLGGMQQKLTLRQAMRRKSAAEERGKEKC